MLTKTSSKILFSEASILLVLALPLIASGVLENSLGFFSTIFLAHLSQEALAAGAIVGWTFATLMVIMWGTLSAVSTMVAHCHGAQDDAGVTRVLCDGLVVAVLAAIPATLLIWNLSPLLLVLGQKPAMVALAQPYLHGLAWAVFPDFIFTVLLHFVIGLGHSKTNLVFTLLWIPINVFLNYVLMFGKWGFPDLNIAGIGWGGAISFWIITTAMAAYIFFSKRYRVYRGYLFKNPKPAHISEIFRVGLPMGFMFCIEIGFFTCVTLVLGTIGEKVLAANQIAMQYLGVFSMISFCFAQAVTVRIGHRLGAGDYAAAERTGYLGMSMAFVLMLFSAVFYWVFAYQMISIDLNVHAAKNHEVVQLAKQFLAICAVFQIFESIRITAFGALRGLKDTHYSMLVSILTFWIIALPLGYGLAVWLQWGGNGLWAAMVISQMVGAAILVNRYKRLIKCYSINTLEQHK